MPTALRVRSAAILLVGAAMLLAPCAWDSSPHDAVEISRALSPFRQPAVAAADGGVPPQAAPQRADDAPSQFRVLRQHREQP